MVVITETWLTQHMNSECRVCLKNCLLDLLLGLHLGQEFRHFLHLLSQDVGIGSPAQVENRIFGVAAHGGSMEEGAKGHDDHQRNGGEDHHLAKITDLLWNNLWNATWVSFIFRPILHILFFS